MSDYFNIDNGEYVHLNGVKRLRTISDKDRQSLRELGPNVDADRFSTRIDRADGTKSYVPETIDEIAAQGVALIDIDQGAFVPQQNIRKVSELTEKDRTKFEQSTGRQMGDFKSRIETSTGAVLSKLECPAVMQRMSRPYQPMTANPDVSQTNGEPSPPPEAMQGLKQQKDAAMSNAQAPKPQTSKSRQREP